MSEPLADTLVRVDWEYEGERFPESTTLENLPMMLASIQQEGGRVIGVRTLESGLHVIQRTAKRSVSL
jgi:hypothetical protein